MTNRKLNLILIIAGSLAGVLHADVVTYNVTPAGGAFAYQFTMTNTGATGGTLFDLFLSLPTNIANINTATIGTPVGWGDPTGGLLFFGPDVAPSTSFIEWAADFSGTYDVGIGNSLSGFSFVSSVNIGSPILYAVNGSTNFAAAVQTPEPNTLVLLIVAIGAIGCRKRYAPVRLPQSKH